MKAASGGVVRRFASGSRLSTAARAMGRSDPGEGRREAEDEARKARRSRAKLRPCEHALRQALLGAEACPGGFLSGGERSTFFELGSHPVLVVLVKLAQVAVHVARRDPGAEQALAQTLKPL